MMPSIFEAHLGERSASRISGYKPTSCRVFFIANSDICVDVHDARCSAGRKVAVYEVDLACVAIICP